MPPRSALLTIPDPLESVEPFLVTGNEYVSLPMISPHNGAIRSISVLSMRARGLYEFRGTPLLVPRLEIGRLVQITNLKWSRLDDWVLQFQWNGNEASFRGTIYAPPGERGFVYTLAVENGGRSQAIRLGMDISWNETALTIFSTRRLKDVRYTGWDRWTNSFVCESSAEQGGAAFAVGADGETENRITEMGNATITRLLRLEAGDKASVAFSVAVGAERDAARTTVVHLRRQGAEDLLGRTRAWLRNHRTRVGDKGSPASSRAFYNLFFSYFNSLGTTIDTEEMASVTSRSPLYYVSAAMWPRDSLLWSFPGILTLDKDKARQLLLTAFTRHLKHPGEHAQYIDGAVLYPGFELDQLCAFPIALFQYWKATGDRPMLSEPEITRGLDKIVQALLAQKDARANLFRTFLLSTDDPAPMPYVTYSNALASVALVMMGEMRKKPVLKILGQQVREAVYEECTAAGVGGRMFAGAVDLAGNHLMFDEPPGSVVVLPLYGFCSSQDPVYRCTVDWINSKRNPHYAERKGVPMPGCEHAPYAWPMSLVNQILSDPKSRRAAVAAQLLAELPMDSELACESVDASTGVVKTGRMMASFAGWLGFALLVAEERESKGWFAFPPNQKVRQSKRA